MRQTFFSNWNIVRVLRLALGVLALSAAFSEQDKIMGLLGAIFTVQAIFNVGCCGAAGCSTDYKETSRTDEKEINYEKIKQ